MSHASTFLLLGGAGGIGAATARRLVAAGHRVVLAGRSAAPMDALAAELGAGVLATHVADLTTFDAVEQAAQAAQAAAPADAPLVGVANLVGSILLKPAHLTREDEYAQVIAQNLTSAFATVRAAAKVLPSGGSVVLVATAAARHGLANHEAIAAAKGGVIGLMRSTAATYASRGLRCNVVAPGLVRTPMAARITGNEAAEKASASLHALGRIGEADDVAPAVAWLLGADAAWVTGQVIGVDGGLATVRSR
ncbi:MAG: oxidoreductase [Gemmatimonas sp.]|uniref:SDR family NAD(P)-dependent oxidoreductase n=1 Tax=Gemmatimonas sp. UBA7669 TaxID=1946568 RepID=UPI0025C624CC|nr:SDR family oxidoreductase [Gemmatimonas sp. UBA7669]MBA3918645.1 oxidoreductase [Gemmatimonas sp.]